MFENQIKLCSFNLQKNVLLVYFWRENSQVGHQDDLTIDDLTIDDLTMFGMMVFITGQNSVKQEVDAECVRTLVSSTVRSARCVYIYRKEEIFFMISITNVVEPDQKLVLLS